MLQELEQKRNRYFSEFKQQHINSFRPHYERGETAGEGPGVWQNVSEHCLAAGVYADVLCEVLNLPKRERAKVIEAAILHDWYKKHESLAMQVAVNDGNLSLKVISQIKQEDARLLREMGVEEEIITLTGANTPQSLDGPQTLPEKIIWYVDAILLNTEVVPIRQRFDNLEIGWNGERNDPVRAARNNLMSNLYREKFGGKSMYALQRELGDKIGVELAKAMGYNGDINLLPLFLNKKLEERVKNQQ